MMGRKNSFIREEAYQESLKILGNCITPDGFYASAIARTNRKSARDYLGAINWANYQSKGKERWGFYEFLDGKNFRVGGMRYQAWSAAAAIMAYEAVINNKVVFLRK